MIRIWSVALVGVFMFGVLSTSASAMVSGRLSYGYKKMDVGSSSDESVSEISVAVHTDPIPFVPVSLGLNYSKLDISDLDMDGYDLGIEVMAWVPFVPVVTPYGRLKYTVAGKLEASNGIEADLSKGQIFVGVKYSIIPLIQVFAEVGYGFQEIESESASSKSAVVGVEVGI